MSELRRRFRDLIAAPETLVMPGAHDALSARIIAAEGFEAIVAGGYAALGTLFAEPDMGQGNMRDIADHYGRICGAVDVPVLVDADTGSTGTSWTWSGSSSSPCSTSGEGGRHGAGIRGREATTTATHEDQAHPVRVYLVVWFWLFVLSFFSYMVDWFQLHGVLRWGLILLFMMLKAGLIVAVFMHMQWERLALAYAILLPPLAVLVFAGLMAMESNYTLLMRRSFLGPEGG